MIKIGVIGAGTWGMALARLLTNSGHDVTVWSALPEEIDEMSLTRRHKNLPGMAIPDALKLTKDDKQVCENKDILLFAVPSVFVRPTASRLAPYIPDRQIIVDVAKGIEPKTNYTMTQVIRDELSKTPGHGHISLVALSGPTHAEEVALDLPATIVSACNDMRIAQKVQDVFMNTYLRVYTNPDVEGIELCGAVKNIMALAAGISSGLGYGDNTRAALITRGMAEITRLGTAMGCSVQTFSGLAGIGDLIVTATSQHSRNNRCGFLIGQGRTPAEAIKEVGMVVEGINAIPATMELSQRYGVEMPIVFAVNDVINNGVDPHDAVMKLMSRDKKAESDGSEQNLMQNRKDEELKRVITYGTFDLLHYGHINLLRRAKAMGDILIVALSTDEFTQDEKNKKCYFPYEQRKALLEAVRYVDLVIPETCWEQKRSDVHEYHVSTFVMGDDWKGKFDFLKDEGVDVVYLSRTPEISTSQIKKDLHDQ